MLSDNVVGTSYVAAYWVSNLLGFSKTKFLILFIIASSCPHPTGTLSRRLRWLTFALSALSLSKAVLRSQWSCTFVRKIVEQHSGGMNGYRGFSCVRNRVLLKEAIVVRLGRAIWKHIAFERCAGHLSSQNLILRFLCQGTPASIVIGKIFNFCEITLSTY